MRSYPIALAVFLLAFLHPVLPFTPHLSSSPRTLPSMLTTSTTPTSFVRDLGFLPPSAFHPARPSSLALYNVPPTTTSTSPVPKVANANPEVDDFSPSRTLTLLIGQSLFIPLSYALAYLLGCTPLLKLSALGPLLPPFTLPMLKLGILYTFPLGAFVLLTSSQESRFPQLKEVAQATESTILSLLGPKLRLLPALLVGLSLGAIAGLGEELLFRGVLQQSLDAYLPGPLPLLLTSALFALGHAITPTYALISFLASCYFGYLFSHFGLAVPVIAHGVYDAVAVVATHWIVAGKTREERDVLRGAFEQGEKK